MSRHRLVMDGTRVYDHGAHVVVGYDRLTGAFYCQLWMSDNDGCPAYTDDCFDLDHLGGLGAVVPPELRDTLIKEALGEINPNYVKDWRITATKG